MNEFQDLLLASAERGPRPAALFLAVVGRLSVLMDANRCLLPRNMTKRHFRPINRIKLYLTGVQTGTRNTREPDSKPEGLFYKQPISR